MKKIIVLLTSLFISQLSLSQVVIEDPVGILPLLDSQVSNLSFEDTFKESDLLKIEHVDCVNQSSKNCSITNETSEIISVCHDIVKIENISENGSDRSEVTRNQYINSKGNVLRMMDTSNLSQKLDMEFLNTVTIKFYNYVETTQKYLGKNQTIFIISALIDANGWVIPVTLEIAPKAPFMAQLRKLEHNMGFAYGHMLVREFTRM